MKHISTYISIGVFSVIAILTLGSVQVLADNIQVVSLQRVQHERILAAANEPSIANNGFASDVEQMNADSDQEQIQISNRNTPSASKKSGTTQDTDGMAVKLIKLAKRQ